VTQYGCPPSLLGDGDKEIEEVSGEVKKNILYWVDKSSQGRTKIFRTGMTSPTGQPRKDQYHLYYFETPFTSVSAGASPF
jgi:hypothetical protein